MGSEIIKGQYDLLCGIMKTDLSEKIAYIFLLRMFFEIDYGDSVYGIKAKCICLIFSCIFINYWFLE